MGNTLGGKKTTKVMKINGETMILKTPVQAGEILKDYPGYVLLESESVKHYGVKAKALEDKQELKPKRLYFLVELPKFEGVNGPRRVRSAINMSAKDRLENLMLARRSTSDLSIIRPKDNSVVEAKERLENGTTRVRMRVRKEDVAKLMADGKDETDVATRIMNLCLANKAATEGGGGVSGTPPKGDSVEQQQMHWRQSGHGRSRDGLKREKRVAFLPINHGDQMQLAVAS